MNFLPESEPAPLDSSWCHPPPPPSEQRGQSGLVYAHDGTLIFENHRLNFLSGQYNFHSETRSAPVLSSLLVPIVSSEGPGCVYPSWSPKMTKRRGTTTSKPPSLPFPSLLLSLPALLLSLLYITRVLLVNYLTDIFSTLATSQNRLDLEDDNSATTCPFLSSS